MIELTTNNFGTEVLKATQPVLVDFYASWCGPCKMIAPGLETLAQELAGQVKFAKVNVDEAPELAMQYGLTGVPTLALFQAGSVADEIVGLVSPSELRRWLAEKAGARVAPAMV